VSSSDPFAAELAEMARERELDAIAAHPRRRARPVAPATAAPAPSALTLTPIGDLLNEPDETINWLVQDRIPAGGIVVVAGKPKAGKSTAIRALCLAVARRTEWLGHACAPGAAWYLALEGRRRDIRDHFRRMGARASDDLRVFVGQAPRNIVAQVEQLATRERPAVIVIDTMQRFLRAESTDDYAEMTTLLDVVIGIAQRSGSTIILLHHAGKTDRASIDSVLGSTAITGSADTVVVINRTDRYRLISTIQRHGDDLPETVIQMDEATGSVRLAGSRQIVEQERLQDELLEALQRAEAPLTREDWIDLIDARRQDKLAAFKLVAGNRHVVAVGAGTRNHPRLYRWQDSDSGSPVPYKNREPESVSLSQTDFLSNHKSYSGSQVPAQDVSGSRSEQDAWPTIWTHHGCYCAALGADAPCGYCDGSDREVAVAH
jgi:KaiC/GvpD/RAD55 family RecA-like ATPase